MALDSAALTAPRRSRGVGRTVTISRLMRLAYLSPTIVESILDGRHPAHLTMKDLMEPFPLDWAAQERHFLAHRP